MGEGSAGTGVRGDYHRRMARPPRYPDLRFHTDTAADAAASESSGSSPAAPDPAPKRPRSRRGRGGITLADVAALAGVAKITASRAINAPDQVSPALLERVRAAVARTGYVPNRLAGGLASNRSGLVAAVVPALSGSVFLESIQSLTDALAASGYQLMLGQSGYQNSREDALLEQIISRRPDGIVLTGILRSPLGRKRLVSSGIPVVETWDLTPTPVDMLVGFSHEKVGARVAEHFHARGRRRVAVMGADDARALRREAGFVERAIALGLDIGQSGDRQGHSATGQAMDPADDLEDDLEDSLTDGQGAGSGITMIRVPAPTSAANGRQALAELLERAPDVEAVFCGSDMMALGARLEAQARGLAVPDRLAIVGFGDLPIAAALNPPLTTVRVDGTVIGQQAARFIIGRTEGMAMAVEPVIDVGFELVVRGTG